MQKSKLADQANACLTNKNVVKKYAKQKNDDIKQQRLAFPKLHGSVTGGEQTPVSEEVQISLQNRFLPLQDIQNDCSCTEPTHSVHTVEISHSMVKQPKNFNSHSQRATNGGKGESCKTQLNSDMEQTSMEVNQTNPKIHIQECSKWQGQDHKNVNSHVTDSNIYLNGNCNLNSIHDINCKPVHVFDINWECKTNGMCVEKQRCIAQTGGYFSFVPQTSLKLYQGPYIQWQHIPDIWQARQIIKNSGTHNYLKCRIPVNSHLNIDRWQYHLKDYWDRQLVDLLHYGFPLDFDRTCPLASTSNNHTSALTDIDHVRRYVEEELQHEAIIGPFNDIPCDLHVSPLMTRAKQDSDKKRTIMDLSWPHNLSVNAGVKKNVYLDTIYELHYPSIDNITDSLVKLGPAAQLYKVDISRAFRHLRVDPADIDLLGFQVDQRHYIDVSTPFGFRHGSLFSRGVLTLSGIS